jgi:hypothetical protein
MKSSLTQPLALSRFGFFQSYYVQLLDRSASDVAWIGSMQMFLLNFVSIFSGRAVDLGYCRLCLMLSCSLQVISIFTTAYSTEY